MRIFEVKNEYLGDRNVAWLFYNEAKKRFYIEISGNADLWETPIPGPIKKETIIPRIINIHSYDLLN